MPLTFAESLPCATHQLAAFQGADELGILAGEDGASEVEHHTHRREQHEEGDLEANQTQIDYPLGEAWREDDLVFQTLGLDEVITRTIFICFKGEWDCFSRWQLRVTLHSKSENSEKP